MTRYVLTTILLFGLFFCYSQETQKIITISIPTIEQEATSIWRTISDIEFFEKHGYNVNLPKNELIDALIIKSNNRIFGSLDYSSIFELLELGIYNRKDYLLALKMVHDQEQLINSMILKLDSLKKYWNWDFKMYENYNVILTLYGSGGSYDYTTGIVTLFITKDGNFKIYSNPANTIIHEIVHIGIEKSIVQRYNLSHSLKERIVDKIVFILFSNFLPEYKIQNIENSKTDDYLNSMQDISNLSKILNDAQEWR